MHDRLRSRWLIGTVMSLVALGAPLPTSAAWYFNGPTQYQQFATTQNIGAGGFTTHAHTAFELVCRNSNNTIEDSRYGTSTSMYWNETLIAPPWIADNGTYHSVEVSGGGQSAGQLVRINP